MNLKPLKKYFPTKQSLKLGPFAINIFTASAIFLASNKIGISSILNSFPSLEAKFLALAMGFAFNLFFIGMLSLPLTPYIHKTFLSILILVSATGAHFTQTLGVRYDRSMLENTLGSNMHEVQGLLSFHMVTSICIYGIIPAVALWLLPTKELKMSRRIAAWSYTLLFAAGMFFISRNLGHEDFAAKSRAEIYATAYTLQPAAPLVAAFEVALDKLKVWRMGYRTIGADAHTQRPPGERKPILLVLILGESARSANFQLYGYPRDTNPELSKKNLVVFPNVESCGTNTVTSLRCIFSGLGMDNYTYDRFITQDNLLDVLDRAGFEIDWYENNWMTDGAGITKRVGITQDFGTSSKSDCPHKECTDAIFIRNIKSILKPQAQDRVVVLHMTGSHFPYERRYPIDRTHYAPACSQSVINECSTEEIINAYDNSIRYTDYIVSQIIDRLQDQDSYAPAMLFVSDHGESLGEGGIFLHSSPVELAPREQREVPLFLWLSNEFSSASGITTDCLRANMPSNLSHDFVYHTVLGLLGVRTSARKVSLDVTTPCVQD